MKQGQDYGGAQDRGCRSYQEDAYHFQPIAGTPGEPEGLLMVAADGMGGHKGGAYASATAVEAFVEAYLGTSGPEAERLRDALTAANERVGSEAKANPALRGMGCTLVGARLTPAGLYMISVGDSPAFLFRDGRLTRLNADHSMAPVLQQAVTVGTLSQDEVASHPQRHALRSVVMGREVSLIDLHEEPIALLPGDKLLLASDGILTLQEDRIVEVLDQNADRTAEELSGILVEAVNQAGNPSQDNITVMLAALPSIAETCTQGCLPAEGTDRPQGRQLAASVSYHLLLRPSVLAGLAAVFSLAAVATWFAPSLISRFTALPTPVEVAPNAKAELTSEPTPDVQVGAVSTKTESEARPQPLKQTNVDAGPPPGQEKRATEQSRTSDMTKQSTVTEDATKAASGQHKPDQP